MKVPCFYGQYDGNHCGSFEDSFGISLGGEPGCSFEMQRDCAESIKATKKEKERKESKAE